MISYSGPFSSDFRTKIEKTFIDELNRLEIPLTENVSMRKFLGQDLKIL